MNAKQKKEQTRLLKTGSGYDCYRFARDVKGADVAALQRRILEVGAGWHCYLFACEVKGADVAALQARVLGVGDGLDCYRFARDVKGADVEKLMARKKELEEKMNAKQIQHICLFAKSEIAKRKTCMAERGDNYADMIASDLDARENSAWEAGYISAMNDIIEFINKKGDEK